MKLNAKQLRELEEKKASGKLKIVKRNPIYFILENIYDTYNIGGLFRLADAVAVEKIYLCGEIEIPPNSRIKKASIGTYKVVSWEYKKSVKDAVHELQGTSKKISQRVINLSEKSDSSNANPSQNFFSLSSNNLTIKQFNNLNVIAVEQHPKAILYSKANYNFPLALIFGNESTGILPETLRLADQVVEIPMWGINKSLNVIVSAAIVSYWVMNLLK